LATVIGAAGIRRLESPNAMETSRAGCCNLAISKHLDLEHLLFCGQEAQAPGSRPHLACFYWLLVPCSQLQQRRSGFQHAVAIDRTQNTMQL
jgi:hypothetical protein